MRFGDQALAEGRLVDAIRSFQTMIELAAGHQDAEATQRLSMAQQRLRKHRDELAEKAGQILNTVRSQTAPRGLRLTDIQQLLDEIKINRELDPEPHVALNRASTDTQAALQALQAAEGDVQVALNRWARARQTKDTLYLDVDLDIQRGLGHFNGRPYVHIELDRTSLESLARRIDIDRDARQAVLALSAAVEQALQNNDPSTARTKFAELRVAEEQVLTTTRQLVEQDRVSGVQLPKVPADCYPSQYAIVRKIADQLKDVRLQAQEAPTTAGLRELALRCATLHSLLETIDRDDRFGLRVAADQDVKVEQLDELEKALMAGSKEFKDATEIEAQSQADASRRLWRVASDKLGAASDKLKTARGLYEAAAATLERPAGLPEAPHRALRSLRDAAQTARQQALQAVQAIDSSGQVASYEQKILEARELLQQANTALGQEDYVGARTLARQASEVDPALAEFGGGHHSPD